MRSYQVALKGKLRVVPPKSKASYDDICDVTKILVEAENRNEARRIGAKFGDVVAVSQQAGND